ncbi:hypothetical protein BT69DRAFT_792049 [Atractiella rhizophila]|nr:hypothetical protein BT69DRAFT_792049 [Atractiella rhizophila]
MHVQMPPIRLTSRGYRILTSRHFHSTCNAHSQLPDHYKILGVDPDAPKEVIKDQFYKRALQPSITSRIRFLPFPFLPLLNLVIIIQSPTAPHRTPSPLFLRLTVLRFRLRLASSHRPRSSISPSD